ncbi:MAG: response regulator [Campylobacterota bacterium]|nr:response regulator [Campylobacterota bacterium]
MLNIKKIIKHTSHLTLLYVEDNKATQENSLFVFNEFFNKIILAVNGQDGIEKFKNNEIDLIITDINMPILNGLDMIQKIKEINDDVPTLILSAHNEASFFLDSIKIGVDGYLLKPIDINQFVGILDKVTKTLQLKKESELNLQLLNQYQTAMDKATIVSKIDPKGIFTYVSDKFCNISGYKKSELLGKFHHIVRDSSLSSNIFKDMWKTVKKDKEIWQGAMQNRTKNGNKYHLFTTVKPILDINNEIVEYMVICNDVTSLVNLNSEVKSLHKYDTQQQLDAREKLEVGIINQVSEDFAKVIYTPLDILSGDFYSLYQCNDGRRFIYIIDGQGHGISPALTVFATSSIINNIIESVTCLTELINHIFPIIKTFLGDIEQLSYTMIMIDENSNTISYSSGGMYPFLLKTDNNIIKIKANNTPFMNFSPNPIVNNFTVAQWRSIILYSDGFVEHEIKDFNELTPENLIENPSLIDVAKDKVKNAQLDDDVTLLYLENF